MRSMLVLALALAMLAASPARADFAQGQTAYDSGDFQGALAQWLPLAEAGDPDAQFRVAEMFKAGEGAPPNAEEAMKFARLAAAQGQPEAGELHSKLLLEDFIFGSDVRAIEALVASIEVDCEREVRCTVGKIWDYIDVAPDQELSLAELARFQRNVVKFAAVQAQGGAADAGEIGALNLGGVMLLPITATAILNSFDYDRSGGLSKAEVLGDSAFAALVGVDAASLAQQVDFQSLGARLQGLFEMLPMGPGGPMGGPPMGGGGMGPGDGPAPNQ